MNINATAIKPEEDFKYLYSVCTLVTNMNEYEQLLVSFTDAGFTNDVCQYLYIDNTAGNGLDAYAGINRFLKCAAGRYVLIVHQDVLLNLDNQQDLTASISEIERMDPNWAVLGNAGGINLKYLSLFVVHTGAPMLFETQFPMKTMTLDEDFLVVKNLANLALSGNLSGFHFYGTDICLIADILGYNSYVIKFKLTHKSLGKVDASVYEMRQKLIDKYTGALRPRFLQTPFARFAVAGGKLRAFLYNSRPVLFLARKYFQLFKPPGDYHLKAPNQPE